jgi:hypothetical protein
MDNLEAFIFNSSTHWFAIRKIDDIWFNLNSTNSVPGPEIISDFYLSAFIQGTEDIGYTNFLVKSLPPLNDVKSYISLQPYQRLVPIDDVIKVRDSKKASKDGKEDSAKDDGNKFKAFAGKGYTIEEGNGGGENEFDGDDEMKQVYEMSMNEYLSGVVLPEEPKGDEDVFNVLLKYNDITLNRLFKPDNTINV